jgi:hypothetical protein
MISDNRGDFETEPVEAAAHLPEPPVERLVVAELVIGLCLVANGRRRKPIPPRLNAAGDAAADRPLADLGSQCTKGMKRCGSTGRSLPG